MVIVSAILKWITDSQICKRIAATALLCSFVHSDLF